MEKNFPTEGRVRVSVENEVGLVTITARDALSSTLAFS
jgi:hypothetical protein